LFDAQKNGGLESSHYTAPSPKHGTRPSSDSFSEALQ
jgi:hypothetical protein